MSLSSAFFIQAVSQDPIAIVEICAAALSGCYVLKLLLSGGQEQSFGRSSLESRCRVVTVPTSVVIKSRARGDLRNRLLRLFAVGEALVIPKKSLRRQRSFLFF